MHMTQNRKNMLMSEVEIEVKMKLVGCSNTLCSVTYNTPKRKQIFFGANKIKNSQPNKEGE